MFEVDFHILNQKATPAIYADTLANRPAFGFAGRLFVNTASPYGIYRDTGSAWVQIAGGGGTSTGINGLNGTTNIGLGGTLTDTFTTINGNGKTFDINNTTAFSFASTNSGIFSGVFGATDYVCLQSNNNSGIFSLYKTKINNQFTVFSGASFGLSLDNITGKFVLGDYANGRKYNSFVVNDDANTFYLTTSFNQANTDQDLFYASNASSGTRFVKIGDFNNYLNGTSFQIDDANSIIKTKNNGFEIGLYFDYTANNYEFGDFFGNLNGSLIAINDSIRTISLQAGSNFNNTRLILDDINSIIKTAYQGGDFGLKLDFAAENYRFGDNNALIECDNSSQTININSPSITLSNTPIITSGTITNTYTPTIPRQFLSIVINGVNKKIELLGV
jgi:hypothetical protein